MEAAVRTGDPAASAEATARYAGDLLPEERYEEWTLGPRERERRLYLDVLRAGRRWEVLVELEPTNEAAHRALMREHLAAGRLHAALRQFQRLREILGRELGVQPSAETLVLYREIVGTASSEGGGYPGVRRHDLPRVREDWPPVADDPAQPGGRAGHLAPPPRARTPRDLGLDPCLLLSPHHGLLAL